MATLGSTQSLDDRGHPAWTELMLLRIPVAEGSQLLEASTTAGTRLPQPPEPHRTRQHHAFVRSINRDRNAVIEVYPVVSFSHQGGAVNGYNAADDTLKRSLLPLPPLSATFPTPQLFGTPLFIDGWAHSRDAFLSVHPVTVELLGSAKFKKFHPLVKLGYKELARIEAYRKALSGNMPHDQGGPSGTASLIRDVEISDEESSDEDRLPTMKDDLMLLAHHNPLWIPQLERYLEKERAEALAECNSRVESWLQNVP